MFEFKTKTATIEGQQITLRELSGAQWNEITEDADMAVIIALSMQDSQVTAEQVRHWPFSIQQRIYDLCTELNGLDQEGN